MKGFYLVSTTKSLHESFFLAGKSKEFVFEMLEKKGYQPNEILSVEYSGNDWAEITKKRWKTRNT